MKMQRWCVVNGLGALTLCLAIAGAANAQPPTGGTLPPASAAPQAAPVVDNYETFTFNMNSSLRMSARGPLYGFSYLDTPEVQQELKLTPEQITQLNKAKNRNVLDPDTIAEAGGQERMTADPLARILFYRLWTAVERSAVADILTEAQVKRHREICIQWEGIYALRRQDVADALHLTGEQRAKIGAYGMALESRTRAIIASRTPTIKPVARRASKPKKDSEWEEFRLKCRAVLTPAQLKQWQEMNGSPFKWLAHSRGQDFS